jgi:membrane protease subunit HflC
MKRFGFIVFISLLLIGGLLLTSAIFVVQESEYAIVTFFGNIAEVHKSAGLKWKIPLVQDVIYFPARSRNLDSPPEHIMTGDNKKLIVDHYVQWKIDNPLTFRNTLTEAKGSKTTTKDYISAAEGRISIITHTALKDMLGKHPLADIISSQRKSIAKEATLHANEDAQKLGIQILDVRIKKVDFPKANVEKAYNLMQAQRYKEAQHYRSRGEESAQTMRAETDLEVASILAEAQREAISIRAQADAEAARLYEESYSQDPGFYEYYRSLQALKKTVDTSTVLMISPESEIYKYLVEGK